MIAPFMASNQVFLMKKMIEIQILEIFPNRTKLCNTLWLYRKNPKMSAGIKDTHLIIKVYPFLIVGLPHLSFDFRGDKKFKLN